MSKYYRFYDLIFLSEIGLPSNPVVEQNHDIIVKMGIIPKKIKHEFKRKDNYIYTGTSIYLYIEGLAYYYINNGNEIVIEPLGQDNEDELIAFFMGPCLSMLLIQRGVIPLHGSAVSINGKAFLILGYSGSGKSTLAAALGQKGAQLICDDIIMIDGSDDKLDVISSNQHQKLWKDSLEQLGLDPENHLKMIDGKDKYYIESDGVTKDYRTELSGVIILEQTSDIELYCRQCNMKEALENVIKYTFWQSLINEITGDKEFFIHCTNMVSNYPVYVIRRPVKLFTIKEQLRAFRAIVEACI